MDDDIGWDKKPHKIEADPDNENGNVDKTSDKEPTTPEHKSEHIPDGRVILIEWLEEIFKRDAPGKRVVNLLE